MSAVRSRFWAGLGTVLLTLVWSTALPASEQAAKTNEKTEKIIIDADVGIDDAMAIVLAYASPELEVVGITTTFGNATLENSTRNARFLVSRLTASGQVPPVVPGSPVPLVADPEPPADFVHGANGLGNYQYDEPQVAARTDLSAAHFIIEQSHRYPGELTLVPIGRLTNLALALRLDPQLPQRIRRVVLMGGAFERQGNVTPVAEANIIGDPHAADIVFGAGWPVVAIGLDVTAQILVSDQDLKPLNKSNPPLGRFLGKISEFYLAFYESTGLEGGFMLHDPAAVLYLTNPELFTLTGAKVRVSTTGLASGQTIPALPPHDTRDGAWAERPEVFYASEVDAARAREVFLERIENASFRANK